MSKEPSREFLQQLNVELNNKGMPIKHYGYFQNLWIYLNATTGFLADKNIEKAMGCSLEWGKSMLTYFVEYNTIKIEFEIDPNKNDLKLRRKITFLVEI